jgi:hypothetical protein
MLSVFAAPPSNAVKDPTPFRLSILDDAAELRRGEEKFPIVPGLVREHGRAIRVSNILIDVGEWTDDLPADLQSNRIPGFPATVCRFSGLIEWGRNVLYLIDLKNRRIPIPKSA